MRWCAVLSAVVLLLSAAPASASSSTPTCFGQPATIVGTEGDDRLEGTDGDDVIVGLGGQDTIEGRGGADRICGGGGRHDELRGGPGRDRLNGGAGDDDLFGGSGGDHLVANAPDWEGIFGDRLHGGGGDDVLIGSRADDELWPGGGRDVVRAKGGEDDAVHYERSRRPVRVDLRAHRGRGQGRDILHGIENVIGSTHDDVLLGDGTGNDLSGNDGDDIIEGRAGVDWIDSGIYEHHGIRQPRALRRGRDQLLGGGGRDFFYLAEGDDKVVGGKGADVVTRLGPGDDSIAGGPGQDEVHFVVGPVTANLSQGTAVADGTIQLSSIEVLRGSEGDDELVGDSGPNTFIGDAGDDLLAGRGGVDTADYGVPGTTEGGIRVDLSQGVAITPEGVDTLTGIENASGTAKRDVLIGDAGANRLIGNGLEDELWGGGGADVLDGGHGADELYGEDGADRLDGGVLIRNAPGHGEGADMLQGGSGDDVLIGRRGDDHLDGGTGFNESDGGPGTDTCLNPTRAQGAKNCEAP